MLAAFSGLVASGLLTCASQAHGALRAVPLAAHTSRARPILCVQDDDIAFSRRKMEATLAEARYEVSRQLEAQADRKSSGACEIMPTLLKQSIVGYQLVWTLGALLLASEIFARLAHVPPPVVSLLDAQLVLNGVLVGLPSAVLVSRLERWRLDGAAAVSAPPSSSSATPPRLTQFATPTLQLVFLPVRPFFPLFVETSGTEVIEQQPAMTATTLLGGTLVGSAWTHGLLQVGWKAILANAALQLAGTSADLAEGAQAVTAFGEDVMAALAGSDAVWQHPLVPLSHFVTAAAPIAAASVAVAAAAVGEGVLSRNLQPLATRRCAEAEADALASLCRRAPAMWALEAPPDAVRRRVAALRSDAARWRADRAEAERRSRIARVGRAAVASAAFGANGLGFGYPVPHPPPPPHPHPHPHSNPPEPGASGGSLLAPVLASLGIVSIRGIKG